MSSVSSSRILIPGPVEGWRNMLDRHVRWANCDEPATQVIGGVHVCDRHGGSASEDLPEAPIIRALTLHVGGERR